VLMVQPHNMPDTVTSFIDLLHLDPDSLVTLTTAASGKCFFCIIKLISENLNIVFFGIVL